MSEAMELQVVAELLRLGCPLNALSRGLLLLQTAALCLIAGAAIEGSLVLIALLLAGLIAGLAQLYFALRVAFDAGLLRDCAERARDPAITVEALADALDRALLAQGLLPAAKAGRAWAPRIAGARSLFKRQCLALLVQGLSVLATLILALLQRGGM